MLILRHISLRALRRYAFPVPLMTLLPPAEGGITVSTGSESIQASTMVQYIEFPRFILAEGRNAERCVEQHEWFAAGLAIRKAQQAEYLSAAKIPVDVMPFQSSHGFTAIHVSADDRATTVLMCVLVDWQLQPGSSAQYERAETM